MKLKLGSGTGEILTYRNAIGHDGASDSNELLTNVISFPSKYVSSFNESEGDMGISVSAGHANKSIVEPLADKSEH